MSLDALRSGQLHGATRVDLQAGLTSLPSELFALADTLEILDLSNNQLSELPADLARLRRLKILFCSGNRFTRLPEILGELPQLSLIGFRGNQIAGIPAASLPPALQWLILTDNRLRELPAVLGGCTRLQKCALAGNQLASLPPEMAACGNLELLRLSANAFVDLPQWLVELPRLAWLAVGGNPLTEEREMAPPAVPTVPWSGLQVGAEIGVGASGVVYQALHDGRPMALKMFKGGLTSDGWARSELAAAAVVGEHPQIIGMHGVLSGHPQAADGLTMPLLAGNFRRLAGPPSFASCTRDVYPSEVMLTAPQCARLIAGLDAALAHLHARGVVHGDVYAHNIMWDGAEDARLGDFGAASLLPPGAFRAAAMACDRRAFAHLAGELQARVVA
jgi:hypothetical protein